MNPDNCSQLEANPYSWNTVANVYVQAPHMYTTKARTHAHGVAHPSIYLESPSGVGFSYTLDGNYSTGDNRTAASNLAFLEGFFKQCACAARWCDCGCRDSTVWCAYVCARLADPEFAEHDFYITGESYGGHYGTAVVPTRAAAARELLTHWHRCPVPQLAQLVAEHPTMSKQLKGFAVGNPSFDFAIDGKYYWDFMYWHALLGQEVRCRPRARRPA